MHFQRWETATQDTAPSHRLLGYSLHSLPSYESVKDTEGHDPTVRCTTLSNVNIQFKYRKLFFFSCRVDELALRTVQRAAFPGNYNTQRAGISTRLTINITNSIYWISLNRSFYKILKFQSELPWPGAAHVRLQKEHRDQLLINCLGQCDRTRLRL